MKKLMIFSIFAGLIPNLINIKSGLLLISSPMFDDIFLFLFFVILLLLVPITLLGGLIKTKKDKLTQWNQQIRVLSPFFVVLISFVLLPLTSLAGHFIRYTNFEGNKAEYINIYQMLKSNKLNNISATGYVNLPNEYKKLPGRIFFFNDNNKIEARVVLTGGFPMMYSRLIFRDNNGKIDLILDQPSWWTYGNIP